MHFYHKIYVKKIRVNNAMEILHNTAVLCTLTYIYEKTVLAEGNEKQPKFFENHSGPVYVKILSYTEKKFFCWSFIISMH